MPHARFTDDDVGLPTEATQRSQPRIVHGVRVTVVSGPDSGASGAVLQASAIVGRSPAAELRLGDPTVSSFHVELSADAGGVAVRDLESRNGTWYQGARIAQAVLPPGAILQLGGSAVRLDVDAPFDASAPVLASFGELRGESPRSRELFAILQRLARTELAILLEGPTGVGKELAARGVHDASVHVGAPFTVLDCTAIPATLAESILFGHERGAFTGADERRPGVFEAAGEGTVFLDEVGELPVDLQPKLLRVLERREVVRVGSNTPLPMRARVVSATWRDLRARINQGLFREDLYYRLAQARVVVPPLRERPEDIPLLVRHFLERLPEGVPCARAIDPVALASLTMRDFPGNVRELRNTVERAAMLADGEVIGPADLSFERMLVGECQRTSQATTRFAPDALGDDLPRFKDAKHTLVDEFERHYLERLVARTGGNLSRASALAGIERHHLRDLLKKHKLRGSD